MISQLLLVVSVICHLIHAVPMDMEKIVGGTDVTGADFSWVVSIGKLKGVPSTQSERQAQPKDVKLKSHFCGGVLVGPKWVLTAAICVDKMQASDIGVGVGGRSLEAIYNKGRISVSRIIIKEGYDGKALSANNIALLELTQPYSSNSLQCIATCLTKGCDCIVKPACVAKTATQDLVEAGWGSIEPIVYDQASRQSTAPVMAPTLKKIALKDTSNHSEECYRRPDLFCTQSVEPNLGPCQFDEGNPLVSGESVVAIATVLFPRYYPTYKLQYCTAYTVHTRIDQHIDWIKQTTKETLCET